MPPAAAPALSLDNAVELTGVTYGYDPHRPVLRGIDMPIRRGKVVAIMGGSGCGKTTILRLIGGQLQPRSGRVIVAGQSVPDMDRDALYAMRRRIGMLFQFGALFTDMSVYENVAFAMREHTDLPEELIRDLVLMKLNAVGLRGAAQLMPSELSGGMIKRASLARALALDPELLFLDEPTSGLDPISAAAFDELIRDLSDSLDLTVFMITHDLDSLYTITDQVAVLADKKVVAMAPVRELEKSSHPWIQEYFGGPRGRMAAQSRAVRGAN